MSRPPSFPLPMRADLTNGDRDQPGSEAFRAVRLTADNARVRQWGNAYTAEHRWTLLLNRGGSYRIRNAHSDKVLAILNGSSAAGSRAGQYSDNGSTKNNWRLVKVS